MVPSSIPLHPLHLPYCTMVGANELYMQINIYKGFTDLSYSVARSMMHLSLAQVLLVICVSIKDATELHEDLTVWGIEPGPACHCGATCLGEVKGLVSMGPGKHRCTCIGCHPLVSEIPKPRAVQRLNIPMPLMPS